MHISGWVHQVTGFTARNADNISDWAMPSWLSHWMAVWLTKLLADGPSDWLIGWVADRLAVSLTTSLIELLPTWLDCLPPWLINPFLVLMRNCKEVKALWSLCCYPSTDFLHCLTGSVGLLLETFRAVCLTCWATTVTSCLGDLLVGCLKEQPFPQVTEWMDEQRSNG